MEKLLSIVVPVYKVEKYINKCLDSLILSDEQMKKLEVIVVNDGTPDNSAVMAKEYEKRYPETFKVIDKENGGHGSAWNKGVELASGKYLRFLDSDDWLTNLPEFVERLEKWDVDLVFTDLQIVNEQTSSLNRLFTASVAMEADQMYRVDDYDWKKTDLMFGGYNVTNFHMCTYRTSLLKKHHPVFYEKMFYDDEILFILPLCEAKTFVYINCTLYNYLLGRVGQSMDPEVMLKHLDFKVRIRKHEVDFYNEYHPELRSVKNKLQRILNSRQFDTFRLMAGLPLRQSLSQMRQMHNWLNDNYPSFDGGKAFALYKVSPVMFWMAYHYLRPLWHNFKVQILKK